MTGKDVGRAATFGGGLIASFLIQIGAICLSAGYQLAQGRVDAAGHVLGFNQPVTQDHFRLMAEALSFSEVLTHEGLVFAVFPAVVTLVFGIDALCFSKLRRARLYWGGQSVVFVVAVAWLWGRAWAGRQFWTGESIVEGELSDAWIVGIWSLAWLPVYGWIVVTRCWISPTVSARKWQATSSILP